MPDAAQFVRDWLTACLPPGTPLMGEVIKAKWLTKGKALATLTMFDGRPGVVEVRKYALTEDAWSIHWLELEGGDINWTGSEWERVAPVRMQLTLDDLAQAEHKEGNR